MVRQRTAMGQLREVSVLMPVALLVMALVSTFALFAYRNTLDLLIEDRVQEAERLGRHLSGDLSLGRIGEIDRLRHRSPQASGIAIFDARGDWVAGDSVRDAGLVQDGSWLTRWLGNPSDAERRGTVSGVTRLKVDGKSYSLRIDLPAHTLRSRQLGLRVLTPLVLAINGAITVIVLLFLRRFLAPFDRMVERARLAGQEAGETQDEAAFLVETFEKALKALTEQPHGDALHALEGTLVRSLESGVLLCDSTGSVLGMNDIGARLLGIAVPELGTPLQQVLEPQSEPLVIFERAIQDGEAVQRQECCVAIGDEEKTLGITVHVLRREDTEVRGFLAIFADLTEAQEEQRERWLAEGLSQLGELTAGAAHELRNSLATLRGYLRLIERDPETEMLADYLAEIRHESDHLQRVLEDFLTFARPGSLRPEEVDLLSLAHRAAADPGLGGAAVEIMFDPASGSEAFSVQGDAQLLERAVRNLLSNAVEAQREVDCQTAVEIRLVGRRQGVEITIDDRGSGLPEGSRERIFDPFFSRRPGGVGMGLALTRRIVLLHRGNLDLTDRDGGGTTAKLLLPVGKTVTDRNGAGGD